jgi:hypothetical protein
MRARVVEMQSEKGFGRAQLASGETLSFDVSVSVLGVPEVGAELEVEVGPARLGGLKITRAEIIPTWDKGTTLPCLCLRRLDEAHAELLYSNGRQAMRAIQPLPDGASVHTGVTGQLILERKRGATNFFETRIAGWSIAAIDASSLQQLLSAYRDVLVDEWEAWEDVDGDHTARALEELRTDLFVGADLGLDIDALLTVTDFPLEPEGPHYVHDMKAYAPRPDAPAKTIRLARSEQ